MHSKKERKKCLHIHQSGLRTDELSPPLRASPHHSRDDEVEDRELPGHPRVRRPRRVHAQQPRAPRQGGAAGELFLTPSTRSLSLSLSRSVSFWQSARAVAYHSMEADDVSSFHRFSSFPFFCVSPRPRSHSQAYSYLHIRHKIFPWGGDCGLFEYGACEGK